MASQERNKYFLVILFMLKVAYCQDIGAVVSILQKHPLQCGRHGWQVTTPDTACGLSGPCSYKGSWCALDKGALTCVPLKPNCQKFLPDQPPTGIGGGGVGIPTSTLFPTESTLFPTESTLFTTIGTLFPTDTTLFPTPAPTAFTTILTTPFVPPDTTVFPRTSVPQFTSAPVGLVQPSPGTGTGSQSGLITLMCGCQPCGCACPIAPPCGGGVAPGRSYPSNSQAPPPYVGGRSYPNRQTPPGYVGAMPGARGFLADPAPIGSTSISCSDNHSRCRAWANRGECAANPRYMFTICRSSCGGCGFTVA